MVMQVTFSSCASMLAAELKRADAPNQMGVREQILNSCA